MLIRSAGRFFDTASLRITASAIFRAFALSYDNPVRWRTAVRCRSAVRLAATCANIARTDQHAASLLRRATVLDQRAAHVPGPLGERLRGNAERLRNLADAHHRTRVTLQDGTA
ncbi:hypothetical protein OG762_03075 [Streptomyces sp. NBC_01136]|uniref:hypothetical protein n=1 Tax=unclassified Streptomyces TaxID=2593676 RepID=UPI0032510900|nr:hypothetical protein OG762_03075 [Streptomyces sp. NBC_01136]